MKILFVLCVTAVLGKFAAADSLMEFSIVPTFEPVIKQFGDTVSLTCNYMKNVISNVSWYDPDGNQIIDGVDPKKSVELSAEQDSVRLEMSDATDDLNGIYRCKGTKQAGNETVPVVVSKTLAVIDKVDIVNTPKQQEFLIGEDASVVCDATGVPEPEFSWYLQNDEGKYDKIATNQGEKYTMSMDSNYLVIRNITKEDEGVYKCTARQESQGDSDFELITVIGNVASKIEDWVPSYNATAGEQAVLNCMASGDPEPSYSWFAGGSSVGSPLSTGSDLELNVTRDMNGLEYTCVAENNGGRDTATAMLTVFVKPSFIIVEDDRTEELEEAVIRCVAEGIPAPEVLMYRDDILLEETTNISAPDRNDSNENGPLSGGGWSSNRRVTYSKSEVTVRFLSTTTDDRGMYECRATNVAGFESADVFLDVEYGPRSPTIYNVWACDEKDYVAQLNCKFDANPPANLSWGRYVPEGSNEMENDTLLMNFTESSLPDGFSLEKTADSLSLVIEIGTAQDPWGDYYCFAENDIGADSATATLRKAESPEAPINVKASNIKTREATITFDVLSPLTPYKMFVIKLVPSSQNATKEGVNLHANEQDSSYEHTFYELDHSMQYTVVVEAINCVDTSDPSDSINFRTLAIENPDSVKIISGKASDEHDKYTVQWRTGGLGGGEIAKILITLYKIEETIDGVNSTKRKVKEIKVSPDILDQENGSYTIENLDPITKYEISVDIYNEVGSATATRTFTTQMRPETTTTADGDIDARVSTGGVDPTLIGIIIGVLLLLIIIVDLICCCSRSWGLSYWVYAHTCRKSEKLTVNDVEEGGGKSRDMVKLDPIDEQAPLQTGEASAAVVASGNGSAEGAKDQESDDPKEKDEKNDHKSPEEEKLVSKDEQ